ncbi:rhodanese-like domain-containing protein [Mycolicibacterium monacense]|nr:rhodanese-like domain-containing protein [Mycolicibacterium monacense]MDA4101118.1 sulfurtransferase [Mycolicibacterium monacense DSM 44395]OBB58440.1 sulfurtransferase [Mycolicibacterium monacense]OBF54107.1 sulfurtransferase [Mycolicibacterium monacense]ORB13356.1 sulfurtransferase [Mycolicibacterium monacense DSM 44395]QHP87926.1 rhodanese-like domain-containing protein [Mycolicibacterium monacense DSM 44395]
MLDRRRRPPRRVLGAVAGACAVLALSACGTDTPTEVSAARLVDPAEFAAAVAEPDRLTINVHVPFEGDIAGTDLSIPFDRIADQADRLPSDRSTALAIYCRSGPMSTTAAESLRDLGYTHVVELRGGMRAWQADGRPLTGI